MTKEEEGPPRVVVAPASDAISAATSAASDEKEVSASASRNNSKNNSGNSSSSVPVIIKAKKELHRRLLVASTEGDIAYLESIVRDNDTDCGGIEALRQAICVSGCTLLHWAAGSNQVAVLEYLLRPRDGREEGGPAIFCDRDGFKAVDLPVIACKKSLGRTPLHYASRNGCLEAVRWLVETGGASVTVRARQGVTPFQLAVWQNRLDVCVFLASAATTSTTTFDPAQDFNDFGCGAVHWLGIAPESRANGHRTGNPNDTDGGWYDDGRDLLPLAKWLSSLPGIDFGVRQRQNHTGLHKAAWGGHLALARYLHEEHDLWDEVSDDAGNYAASLADMAHTPKHSKIAAYLRRHCSRKKEESLSLLGLSGATAATLDKDTIRRAYLAKAKQLHPDRLVSNADNAAACSNHTEGGAPEVTFDALRKAYLHLTEEDGLGDQSNPAHSLNLMLRYVHNHAGSGGDKTNSLEKDHTVSPSGEGEEDDSFFKARLVAVLLEYGDKGIDLSNVKKKWKQVWPKVPFPSQQRTATCRQQQSKKIPMAEFLLQKAGDVIRFERHGDKNRRVLVLLKNRNSSKESVLNSGSDVTSENELLSEVVKGSRQ